MPASLRLFLARLKGLFQQRSDEQEFQQELDAHFDLLAQRYMRLGMTAAEAEAAAKRQLGGVTQLKEDLRERRSILLFETLFQDSRFALRQFRKSPAFSLTAILTLALGIGANAAIFSIVYAVLLRPMPFKDTNQLVMVWEQNPHRGWYHNIVSAANFNDWRKQNHVFTDMALISPTHFNVTGTAEPLEVMAAQVTPNFFSLIGVQPLYGRTFLPEEGRPGSARVVVISHALWSRRFARDRSIIGTQVSLNSENYTVIGVMPARFSDVFSISLLDSSAQLWISGLDLSDPGRTNHGYTAVARLRPGVTLQAAQSEMNTIAARLEKQYPDNKGWGVGLISVHDDVVGNSRPALLVLLVAVGLVLLIICVNLANLLLARGAVRQREVALRKALGASRSRVIGQLLIESFLLSACGAIIGLAFASFSTKGLIAIAPVDTPGIESAGLNVLVVVYTATIAFLTALIFGLFPAFGISNVDLSNSLKESGRTSSEGAGTGKIRGLLVSGEFALALMLVVGAGLMVKTLLFMHGIELGFKPDHVLSLRVPLNDVKYNERQQAEFFHTLLARLSTAPGIQYASVSRGVPFNGWAGQGFATQENPSPALFDIPNANYLEVGPQYFNVLRIPLIKGRFFTEQDSDGALRVAIVNQELARKEWPGQNPIGKRIRVTWDKAQWQTVVGVVGNVRTQGPEASFFPEIYAPYMQHPWLLYPRHLLIRTYGNPMSVVGSVRHIIRELDKDQPVADVRPLDAIAQQPLALRRFLTDLLGGFACIALLLAAIGVYGVMAYSVAQRTRELGIRMALGADQAHVLRIVFQDGARLATSGIVIGLLGALAATRLLSSQLYGVQPSDPWTFCVVSFVLAGVAALATYIPAWRAARVDPVAVLRHE